MGTRLLGDCRSPAIAIRRRRCGGATVSLQVKRPVPRPTRYRLHAAVVGKSALAARRAAAVAIKDGNFTCPIVRGVTCRRLAVVTRVRRNNDPSDFMSHVTRLTVSVGVFSSASRHAWLNAVCLQGAGGCQLASITVWTTGFRLQRLLVKGTFSILSF